MFFLSFSLFKKVSFCTILDLQCCVSFRRMAERFIIHIHICILFQILFLFGLLQVIEQNSLWYTVAAAKSLQSCPTLCDPIDGSSPGSPVPGILQARTLQWVAISFSNA